MCQSNEGLLHQDVLAGQEGSLGDRVMGARLSADYHGVNAVNPQGVLVYAGGIDSIPSARPADIEKATNYVKVGLAETLAGKPISAATTQPYGCSIKYKSAS